MFSPSCSFLYLFGILLTALYFACLHVCLFVCWFVLEWHILSTFFYYMNDFHCVLSPGQGVQLAISLKSPSCFCKHISCRGSLKNDAHWVLCREQLAVSNKWDTNRTTCVSSSFMSSTPTAPSYMSGHNFTSRFSPQHLQQFHTRKMELIDISTALITSIGLTLKSI